MDSQTSLLVSSVIINILLIIERFMKRIIKSECCGNKIELEKSKSEINLSNIKDDRTNNQQIPNNVPQGHEKV